MTSISSSVTGEFIIADSRSGSPAAPSGSSSKAHRQPARFSAASATSKTTFWRSPKAPTARRLFARSIRRPGTGRSGGWTRASPASSTHRWSGTSKPARACSTPTISSMVYPSRFALPGRRWIRIRLGGSRRSRQMRASPGKRTGPWTSPEFRAELAMLPSPHTITTDPHCLDLVAIHVFLSQIR